MTKIFRNRSEAGKLLAQSLSAYANSSEVLVLGLPRGGVPVAFEVAKALQVPLDICLVRKLGVPGYKELAMGAIASGHVIFINEDVVQSLGISQEAIEKVIAAERRELKRRERVYRSGQPAPNIKGKTIILIDDGIATGSTIRAALATLRQQQPQKIVLAIPVAPPEACHSLKAEVDELVCLLAPEWFCAIGLWYEDFAQTTDSQVRQLLADKELQRQEHQGSWLDALLRKAPAPGKI